MRGLTGKLRVRTEVRNQAPWVCKLFRARVARAPAVHGPLQRMLDTTSGTVDSFGNCAGETTGWLPAEALPLNR